MVFQILQYIKTCWRLLTHLKCQIYCILHKCLYHNVNLVCMGRIYLILICFVLLYIFTLYTSVYCSGPKPFRMVGDNKCHMYSNLKRQDIISSLLSLSVVHHVHVRIISQRDLTLVTHAVNIMSGKMACIQ